MNDLLEAVTTVHSGSDRWDAVRSVDVTFNFSGGLLDLKGFPGHHRPTASVDVRQPHVVRARLHERGGPNMRWTINDRSDRTVSALTHEAEVARGRRPTTNQKEARS
jgi:hypothetical protein